MHEIKKRDSKKTKTQSKDLVLCTGNFVSWHAIVAHIIARRDNPPEVLH